MWINLGKISIVLLRNMLLYMVKSIRNCILRNDHGSLEIVAKCTFLVPIFL